MTIGWRRAVFAALVLLQVCLLGVVSAARQAWTDPAPVMAENYFKNVQVL
jgi:hypothetical protein